MKFLALETPVSDAPVDIPATVLEDEARAAWALYRDGVVRELYFRADRREAVLFLECTEEQARAALASLPLVRRGYIGFDLLPLVPYDGFARLFRSEAEETTP